jgi:probable F420-dependent oxidoreductase
MRVETILPLDDWRAAMDAAKAAEAAGYDGAGTAEMAHDPFTPLAFAALATERIQLSTGIVVAFPRSPTVLASSAWDLQTHSRGRFALGLGSQVKGHIERRFGLRWTSPVARMREYVGALRAIWRCWELGEPLHYEGDHYQLTLMTPEFSPRPSGLPPIPVSVAAVGPDMIRMAGRVCDGVRLHGFCTRRYLEEVAIPQIDEGLARSGRERARFEIWGGGFIATGPDEDAVRKAVEEIRYRVSFYGSTRSYRRVFELHGLEELTAKLHRLSVDGKWAEMPRQISDEVLGLFAAIGTYDRIAQQIEQRFGGLVDVVTLSVPGTTPEGLQRELIQDIRRIPSPFEGHATDWTG